MLAQAHDAFIEELAGQMATQNPGLSTGLPSLDSVLRGLIAGDNLVWQIDRLEDFLPFVEPYCTAALEGGRKLVYFRFADHAPLIGDGCGAEVHDLDPAAGFEGFITDIHRTIEQSPRGSYYLFDCLSGLAGHWYSDPMLANFFMLTCPYLYDVEAIAYFPIFRENHSLDAIVPIQETAQVILDVYDFKDKIYVQPLKVQQRYSPTMHMLHVWEDGEFPPVTESAIISEILTSVPSLQLQAADSRGIWKGTFFKAQEVLAESTRPGCQLDKGEVAETFENLMKMAVSRDERVCRLIRKYLRIEDLIGIGRRTVGTGLIGGKTVGMLLARAILREADANWREVLEPHDSFYIASDVFYTFLVRNGIWWMRQRQKDPKNFLKEAERARQRILVGTFPPEIRAQFERMLDYFGQSPIIVRSSSLLEDNFGNAFSGKYESVFCANQGPRERRISDFLSAVRTIYASTMSEKALSYRAARGILDRDEQMALLVQRVSGAMYGTLYFPQVAGVGFSYNPYVWNEHIEPEAGMLRLVFGLGTRAVDRADDDYTRVVALNAPTRRPESNFDQVKQYAQRKVDVIDIEANQLVSRAFNEIALKSAKLPLDMFASRDHELARVAAERDMWNVAPYVLTFDALLTQTGFVEDMSRILATLQKAYDYPVDVEFTANFFEKDSYRINVLQCRPFQVKGGGVISEPPADIPREKTVLEAHGAVIGQSREVRLDRLVFVAPNVYGQMTLSDRYSVARLIGRVIHPVGREDESPTLLLGPGRWGTTTPWLGVPVTFSEINRISALCEIVAMREDLVPDVSLGTHFFNDLVETDILYLALFPSRKDNFLNRDLFDRLPNRLDRYLKDADKWAEAIRVVEAEDLPGGASFILNSNILKQRVVVYIA